VSLNNRISIRDTYGTRGLGGAVDCQVAMHPGSVRSEATTDVMLLESEKHLKRHPLTGVDLDGRVVGESRALHFTVLSCPEQIPSGADIA
jgi:hypothetical protein